MTPISDADLPAPSGYEACPRCWTMTVVGLDVGVGEMSSVCCQSLNGDFNLCFKECESKNGVLVWRTECFDEGVNCQPQSSDRYRSKWSLFYTIDANYWTLRSINAAEHPIYQLYDETPCDGNDKVLARELPGASGCDMSPETITITPGVDCAECAVPADLGCSVSLTRYCGGTKYEMRTSSLLSAVNNDNFGSVVEADTELPQNHGCCNVAYDYPAWTGCCPDQRLDFHGYVDPWRDPPTDSVVTWELDIDSVPAILTGTFTQGTVTYTADEAIKCKGATHFTLTDNSLSGGIHMPQTCCLVPDSIVTCNVRLGYPDDEGTPPYNHDSPQQNAGYNASTGQEDFCACFDTCEPTIPGTIVVEDDGVVCMEETVCFTRQNEVAPQDPSARTQYPRIGCSRVWDGEKWNVLTQVVYCVGDREGGPGNVWASDFYCTQGSVGDFARDCNPCSAYIGTYLGTTYAVKDPDCHEWPFFDLPDPPEATNLCVCTGEPPPPPPVETDCCPDDPVPTTLYLTIDDGDICPDLTGVTATLVYNDGTGDWRGPASPDCGLGTIILQCRVGPPAAWYITSDPYNLDFEATTVNCSPFSLEFAGAGLGLDVSCCTPHSGVSLTMSVVP